MTRDTPPRRPATDETPRRRAEGPLSVAVAPSASAILESFAASGRCPVPIRIETVGEDGRLCRPNATAEVFWRHGRVSREWASAAMEGIDGLAWAHSDFVGVDGLPLDRLRARGVVLTNGVGNYSRPMAEWVILAMLSAAKSFPEAVRRSDTGRWEPVGTLEEMTGKVALLLGLGSTNRLVVGPATALGIEVWAAVRSPRPVPDGISELFVGEAWKDRLGEVDYLVLGLPHTPETDGIIDAEVLRRLPSSAWLINVARGALVDEEALVAALDGGIIAGALLDAFRQEPLPQSHPLWGRPNVTIVPHHSWSSPLVDKRIEELFFSQLLRWVGGEALENVVDYGAGY